MKYIEYSIIISISIVFLAFFTACQSQHEEKKHSDVTLDTIFTTDGKIDQILSLKNGKLEGVCEIYYSSGKLKSKKTFRSDTVRGIIESFYENGSIMKFAYAIDNDHNIYFRHYDSSGRIIEKGGTPLISSYVHQSKSQDTFHLKALICTYGCSEIKLEISPDAQSYKEMKLVKTEDPFISELNTWKPVSGLPRFSVYLRTTCMDAYENSIVYLDTLSFKRSNN